MSEGELADKEIIEKAAIIEDMVNHPGWKLLGEMIEGVLQREVQALTGQKLDDMYYRKIGFLQMYKFCKEIPDVIKDKSVRKFLLHQGRALGARTFQNPAKHFFEGIMKGNAILKSQLGKSQTELIEGKKREFHESSLQ